jgi:two-component system, LuxR family, sensor kinase FixL
VSRDFRLPGAAGDEAPFAADAPRLSSRRLICQNAGATMNASSLGPNLDAQILAAFFNASEDAIIVKDLSGRVLSWNRGAERIYGYSADEMIGASIARLVPADYAAEYAGILSRIRRGERFDLTNTVRVTKSGQRIDVSLTVWPIFNENREPVAACVTARDLTEQRYAERELRNSEARWRAIIESAVDGIVMIDQRGRIEFFNPAAERLFGYRRDEVLGRNVSMLMPSPYGDEHDHYLKRYQMTRERHIIGIGREVTGCRKDGTTFPVHLSVGELSLEGETKFTGIIRDLTDRVKLENKLLEESGLVRIGELAAVLAHEVKNPLAAVSGAVQVLSEHLPAEEDREIAQEILNRLEGLSSLMSDLLLFARPPRPQTRPVVISGLLEALVDFFKGDPAWRELEVVIEGESGSITADPELLKMAIQNLLLNAAQAQRGKGKVRVRLVEFNSSLAIDVIDQGPGIPAELHDRLFTPFFTTKARGTGLGLATVRRITEAHGGEVHIIETGPTGTIVRVTLPHRPQGSHSWRDS